MALAARISRSLKNLRELSPTQGYVDSVKNNIVSIFGLNAAKKGDFVKIGDNHAWVFALLEEKVLAACLSEKIEKLEGDVTLDINFKLQVPVNAANTILHPLSPKNEGLDFSKFLNLKPSLKHLPCTKMLTSGFLQVDLMQPLSYGQSVMLHGKSNLGKTKLAMSAAKQFLNAGDNHKVVIANPNPYINASALQAYINSPNSVIYSSKHLSSDISQYFTPYFALAHACYLRDQGNHVFLLINDLLHHTFIERSLFYQYKLMPTNIANMIFEHSKYLSDKSSLTSVTILEENSEDNIHNTLSLGMAVHMRSFVNQVINFETIKKPFIDNRPSLDFTKGKKIPIIWQHPILQSIRAEFIEIFSDLKQMQELEEARSKLNIKTEPWEKYLLLDSNYFLKLMNQDTPMELWEQIIFLNFCIYVIKNEMVSMIKSDMKIVRNEFLEFIRKSVDTTVNGLKYRISEATDVQDIRKKLNKAINEVFLEELKRKGNLKPHKEDYEELIASSHSTSVEALPKNVNEDITTRQVLQEKYESIIGTGKDDNS
ncbi:unnamed protein product [Blepharisma stoltei]|uniref:ATPase F1/V1/A1 complex alpha/beta subunit nucleotide-binding domain-containing protein n=1 Tax=Blepharisma stoltei TaxID=1481888 RepID=A0AAU9IZ85_9CILI|nr:unnamed protein product [Blepharisma stoltei]